MVNFSSRFIEILQLLNRQPGYMTLKELSDVLNISSKTVSRTIKTDASNHEECRALGFSIAAKQGYGYCLTIEDAVEFERFKEQYFFGMVGTNDEKSLREKEIIQILLTQEDYITIQALADKIYVSESTISAGLKNIRHILKRYGLELANKPAVGIKITGSEMNLRLCYAKYVVDLKNQTSELSYSNADIQFVEQSILEVLLKWKVQIADLSCQHLISHVFVSLYRMQQGYFITFSPSEAAGIIETKEYEIAVDMVKLLKKRFEIADIEEETIYIAIQILGKRSLSSQQNEVVLMKDIQQILFEIFAEIKERLAVDLTEDNTVFNYLALHFEPMFTRLKYGIKSNNPLMEEVKSQQPTSFEMGLIAKRIIMDHYQYVLDDNEVSYLAMYFSLALDRLNYLKKPKNILIVCGLGVCSSRILGYKLRQQYGQYIGDIVTCQFHELKAISFRSFDCIISTVNQPIGTNLPVIYIDDFLNNLKDKKLEDFFLNQHITTFNMNDYLKEAHFFHAETMENEEQAIDYLLAQLGKVNPLPTKLKASILEREKLSSTAFGNYCALPHPVQMCTEETIFAVLVLNKSMQWGGKKVRCIFLLSPSKHQPQDLRNFNDCLAKVILDSKQFIKFSQTPNFETLHNLFLVL